MTTKQTPSIDEDSEIWMKALEKVSMWSLDRFYTISKVKSQLWCLVWLKIWAVKRTLWYSKLGPKIYRLNVNVFTNCKVYFRMFYLLTNLIISSWVHLFIYFNISVLKFFTKVLNTLPCFEEKWPQKDLSKHSRLVNALPHNDNTGLTNAYIKMR